MQLLYACKYVYAKLSLSLFLTNTYEARLSFIPNGEDVFHENSNYPDVCNLARSPVSPLENGISPFDQLSFHRGNTMRGAGGRVYYKIIRQIGVYRSVGQAALDLYQIIRGWSIYKTSRLE